MAIDETASTVSLAPDVCIVPGLSVAVQEGEECAQDFLDHANGEESAARHHDVLGSEVDDNDSFVDIMNGITAVDDVESEGWTFADALARAKCSVDTLAEGVVDTSCLHTC